MPVATSATPLIDAADIARVRRSFVLVDAIAPQAAALFYANLFERAPKLRALFRGDLQAQGAKLMQMIGAAVALLDRPAQLQPVLRHLGARHAGYGVGDMHYASVGSALIQTLAQGLGEAFTDEVRMSWLKVYGLISQEMMAGAAPRHVAPVAMAMAFS